MSEALAVAAQVVRTDVCLICYPASWTGRSQANRLAAHQAFG